MLNFINKVIINYNTYKINNRIIKEKTTAVNAQNKRDRDIAMTNIAEAVTDYFIIRDKELRFADETLLNRLIISRDLLRNTLRRCQSL